MKTNIPIIPLFALLAATPETFVTAAEGTPIKISIVAFAGKVTIKNPEGKSLAPAKDAIIPVGSTISTGASSWIDLAQGGLSVVRVLSRTKTFEIQESSFDEKTKQSSTVFKLRNGSAFVRANEKALTKGSKYQVQMPELIAGVVGSQCEAVTGPKGDSIMNVKGHICGFMGNTKGIIQPIGENEMMFYQRGDPSPGLVPMPEPLKQHVNAVANTLPDPTGDAKDGEAKGGTNGGTAPAPQLPESAISPGVTGGSAEVIQHGGAEAPLVTAPSSAPAAATTSSSTDTAKVGTTTTTPPPSPPPASSPSSP